MRTLRPLRAVLLASTLLAAAACGGATSPPVAPVAHAPDARGCGRAFDASRAPVPVELTRTGSLRPGASRWPATTRRARPWPGNVDHRDVPHLGLVLARLTRAGDAATLETTEAFIDLQTMGTPFVSPSSTQLVKVATGPDSLGVFESEDMNEEQMKLVREELHREKRSQRARTVAVNLSFSQMETEPAPLLSVTFGWVGKDQQLRF